MWNVICEAAKKKWRKEGKDPYQEWDKFQAKENFREQLNFEQKCRGSFLRRSK